jgi:hypothetical protein
MMTQQEAFNKAYLGIIKQGGPAIIGTKSCRYRTIDGKKCGVGQLFPDSEYKEGFEGKRANLIAGFVPSLARLNPHFLTNLQGAHDGAAGGPREFFITDFKQRMAYIAKQYKLEIPDEASA